MRRAFSRSLFGFLILLVACCAWSQTPQQPDFRALYDRYEKDVRGMNVEAYMSMFTDDFTMVSPDGKVHEREEMGKYQKVNAATTKKVNSYSVTIESVTPMTGGDFGVIVLQKYDRDQAPMDQPGKTHNIKTSVVQRETWHLQHGSWKIRRIEELLTGPVYFDGKIMEQ